MDDSCLTIRQVAKRLGVNVTTIYRLTLKGDLPAFKVGSQWRFNRSALEAWMADQTTIGWFAADQRAVPQKRG